MIIGNDGNEAKTPQELLRQSLRNVILDFIYKQVKKGATNHQINLRLKAKRFPPMPEDKINGLRQWFKEAEHHCPEKMALFKRRLLGC